MEPIRVVELFAGVGGFRLGLEQASERFHIIWANQWEPSMREQYAFDCYTAHYGISKNHICRDIALVKNSIPDHDLLVGGFPCQDYSVAKKGSVGIEGPKGVLWWQIDDIVYKKRPQYILLENVDRLIRSPAKQHGRDFSVILRCLYEKGYAVEWRVINASDYGQAQRRRRTFIGLVQITTIDGNLSNTLIVFQSILISAFFAMLSILIGKQNETNENELYITVLKETASVILLEIILCVVSVMLSVATIFLGATLNPFLLQIISAANYYIIFVVILNLLIIIKRIKALIDNA